MFSKACEYAIRATLYISEHTDSEKRVSLKEIASATDTPEAFTAKILQQLVKHKILLSTKGPSGGFQIERHKLQNTSLREIVEAIDGDDIYNGCGLGLKECDANKPCPVHDHFVSIRNELKQMLESTKLDELTKGLKSGRAVLKR